MKNYIKRIIAFVHGVVIGALLYKFFTNSVLLNYVIKDFKHKVTTYQPRSYTAYSLYNKRDHNDFDIHDYAFESRSDAEQILKQIKMEIEKYEFCSVARLKELTDKETSWSDQHIGWTELSDDVRVCRKRDGKFYIDLPDPKELD